MLRNNYTIRQVFIMVLLAIGLLFFGANNSEAQDLNSTWTGHLLSAKGRIPANAAVNWDTGKWGINLPPNSWTSWNIELEIGGDYNDLHGTYSSTDKNNPKVRGKYSFTGNFNFNQKLMVWQPDKKLEGTVVFSHTVIRSLTYSQEADYEYLRGRWVSQDGTSGVMEFRRAFSGTPLKPNTHEVKSDFLDVETGTEYTIANNGIFLSVTDDQTGIVAKTDSKEDFRKWIFEPAPEAFRKSFRIIPVHDKSKCLEPRPDDDTGAIILADKADKAEGEQYWRFEIEGEGVRLVNVKLGGRSIYIENKETGETIIRSLNESHNDSWKLNKE